MPVTRFSLSDLPDLSNLRRATILYPARVADFPLHLLSPDHSRPQPQRLCHPDNGWMGRKKRRIP